MNRALLLAALAALSLSISCAQDRFSSRATAKIIGPEGGTLESPPPKNFRLFIRPGVLTDSEVIWIHEDSDTYVRRAASSIFRIEPAELHVAEGATITMATTDPQLLLARLQDPRPAPLAGQVLHFSDIEASITQFGAFLLVRETCREVSRLRDAGVLQPVENEPECPPPPGGPDIRPDPLSPDVTPSGDT